MAEYARICVNTPVFFFKFLYFYICFTIAFLLETRVYGLKEPEGDSLKRQKLIFSIAAGSISFVFFLG